MAKRLEATEAVASYVRLIPEHLLPNCRSAIIVQYLAGVSGEFAVGPFNRDSQADPVVRTRSSRQEPERRSWKNDGPADSQCARNYSRWGNDKRATRTCDRDER
jgi:hypothetical protein